MNVINYDTLLENTIKENIEKGVKPKLLLHSCCAPCSSYCIEKLKSGFDITIFYYNPNIDTKEEFEQRLLEQEHLCKEFNVPIISTNHLKEDFKIVIKGLENEKEGGARCEKCFALRLRETAKLAKQKGFEFFATTLTVSPLKNAKLINQIGLNISKEKGIEYLPTDFKKQGGYLRSIELSKQYNLYRQNYCGCEYSKKDN